MQLATVTKYPITPLKMPFAGRAKTDGSYKFSSIQAGGGVNVSNLPQDGNTVANIELGFPEVFSTPITKNGKYLKRADVNALGYISTIMAYRYQMGLPNEWNSDICNTVGGYPKNAVLDYCERDSSGIITETYKITSCVDNNMTKPTATVIKEAKFWRRVSINAEYVSSTLPINNKSYIITSNSILDERSYSPVFEPDDKYHTYSYTMPFDGFLNIYFAWDNKDEDGSMFQILSGNSVKMEIQCFRDVEKDNSDALRWFNGFPLAKGLTARFRGTSRPFIHTKRSILIYKAMSFG